MSLAIYQLGFTLLPNLKVTSVFEWVKIVFFQMPWKIRIVQMAVDVVHALEVADDISFYKIMIVLWYKDLLCNFFF